MNIQTSRAAGLAYAIALEAVRVWSDSNRNFASLNAIQRDAENFTSYVDNGAWKVVIGERRNESNPSNGSHERTLQH